MEPAPTLVAAPKPRSGRRSGMVVAFHVVYTLLAIQFFVPAMVYAFWPDVAVAEFVRLGRLFGGVQYAHTEDSVLWRVLAVANVLTLSFCCILIQVDLRRLFAVLAPLVFLKSMAALGLLLAWWVERYPGHFAGFALDLATVLVMLVLAIAARRTLGPLPR